MEKKHVPFCKMVTITGKGQVTIPKQVREQLKLSDTDLITIWIEGNKAVFMKATDYLKQKK
jgi:AbrB family looped-hinge helix DNA binding protein